MSRSKRTSAQDPFYISVDEMSELSGTPKPTLYRWLQKGIIPALHLGPSGRTKRVPRDVFMEMLAKSAKGVDLRAVLSTRQWVKTKMPELAVRRVPAETPLDIAHHPEPAVGPVLDHREVQRLAHLERRYRIGSASLAVKLEKGEPPPRALPKKTAEQWVGAFTRTTIR